MNIYSEDYISKYPQIPSALFSALSIMCYDYTCSIMRLTKGEKYQCNICNVSPYFYCSGFPTQLKGIE